MSLMKLEKPLICSENPLGNLTSYKTKIRVLNFFSGKKITVE